jgi:hypothetical protein
MYISVVGGNSTNITTWTNQFGNTVWTKTWNTTTYDSNGCKISTSYKASSDLGQGSTSFQLVSRTFYDFQGRVIATHTPAPHSSFLTSPFTFQTSSNFYDSVEDGGRLAFTTRSGTTINDKRTTIYAYNSLGHLKYTAQDANDNGSIDLSGSDRIPVRQPTTKKLTTSGGKHQPPTSGHKQTPPPAPRPLFPERK